MKKNTFVGNLKTFLRRPYYAIKAIQTYIYTIFQYRNNKELFKINVTSLRKREEILTNKKFPDNSFLNS